jgi:hypothetical protein
MITQRFRPLFWVAGVATAATALYLVSLQVATERGRLDDVDRRIASAKRDLRQLQTELGTRASLRQLEKWNADALALSAPRASQYASSEAALKDFDASALSGKENGPPPVMVAAATVEPPKPASASAATTIAPAPPKPQQTAFVAQATKPKPKSAHVERTAMVDDKLLDRRAVSDLGRQATHERHSGEKPRP